MTNTNNNNGNSNRTANHNTNTNKNANSDVTNTNENSNARSTLTSFSDDFSKQDWRTGSSTYGTMWYADEEYHMKGVKGFYFVIYAPDKPDYKTKNATVRIGTRSIDGVSPTCTAATIPNTKSSIRRAERTRPLSSGLRSAPFAAAPRRTSSRSEFAIESWTSISTDNS
ncbi:MAG: hypothetical protein DMF72_16695 [Acidobacteria bacterium]|nr:MAG: hypothetical protein DMF72_16695 [Acidobacteriota bacterium]